MKFSSIFMLYSLFLGFCVGIFSALFLVIVNFLIQVVWQTIPEALSFPIYYPLIVSLIGGGVIGLFQKKVGQYPKTIEETLKEFKEQKTVTYKHRVGKNFSAALAVLTFGASLGPEAALGSLLGEGISWIGDQMKWTLAKREQLLEVSLGTMLAVIFHAPFMGVAQPLEQEQENIRIKWKKIVLYVATTIVGILGFTFTQKLFPQEKVFEIRTPAITWDINLLYVILPAILCGIGFGYLFLFSETVSERIAKKINHPLLLALLAGLLIGIFGMISSYFLFSGEHSVGTLSREYQKLTIGYLLFLAVGKMCLTNISFAFGWRGGKIFPAIFTSVAVGLAFVKLFPFTPGLLVSIIVASSLTIILKQVWVTAALLLFLFPLQFFPVILFVCWLTKQVSNKIQPSK